jgi:UDP-arabinose 4-epimerase
MKGRRILVTGGAGYIGSHTCKALAAAGAHPIVFDNLSTGHREAVRFGPLVVGDLADRAPLERTLRDERIDAVIHFAASAYVGESMVDPAKYFRNNVTGTLTLLEALQATGVATMVFSSTCATYGVPTQVPIPEGHAQQPVNPYGESKLFIEKALHWYGVCHGLRWLALRYFNAAGADPAGELGENHEPETHLIPLAIQAALGQRGALKVMGTDYATPDGTAVRDYIHVTDLADAHVRALGFLLQGGASGALNLGTGRGHSVRDVIAAVESASGRPVPHEDAPRRAGDPPALVAAPGRAADVLGWVPEHSALETIVRSALRWHVAHPHQPAHPTATYPAPQIAPRLVKA